MSEDWRWLTSALPDRPKMCGALTVDQVVEIFHSSMPGRELAREYKVSEAAVSRIRNGNAWTEITSSAEREVA